jgi:signal transduction histidine kinase
LVVLLFSGLIVVCAPAFLAVAFYAYDTPVVGLITLGAACIGALTPTILRVTRSIPIAASALTFAITLNVTLVVGSAEGLTSPALPWLALIPVFAIATAGRRAGIIWSLICLLLVLFLLVTTRLEMIPSHEMPLDQRQSASAWNTILLVVFVAGFLIMYEGLRERSVQALRKMHEELDLARRRQMVADRLAALGTLAAGVGHEINNPLTYVLGNLKEIRAEMDDLGSTSLSPQQLAQWSEGIDEAIEGSTRVATIVGDLRAFARTDDEPLKSIEPAAIVRSALRITAAYWRDRAKVVEQLDHLPRVRGAPSKLIQVFVNLITNAVAAMPDRPSTESLIRLVGKRNGASVEIAVEDNGSGITPEVMARMFEPFFTTKPVGSGTGLGLATSRAYVQAGGGRLEVSSTVGAGATFTVILPVADEEK